MGEETKNVERKELTPLQIAELKVSVLEGEVKVWMYKCEQLELRLSAKLTAHDDLMDDFDELF